MSRQNRIEHFAIVQKSKQNYTVSNFSILADTSLTYLNSDSDLLNGTLCVDWPVTYEKAFYESDTRDRLKVPPYNYVKRQPRDYTKEN